MRIFFVIILSLFLFPGLFAQSKKKKKKIPTRAEQRIIDSLSTKLQKDSLHLYRFQTVRPYLHIDNRKSRINKTPVNIRGIQVGIRLYERSTTGLGFYALSQNSRKPINTIDGTVSAKRSLAMNYFTFFYSYSFISTKNFELNLPVEIGLGKYRLTFSDSLSGVVYREEAGRIIPLGLGLQVILKPTRWIGFSLLLGYRAVAEKSLTQNFNGIYSSIGLTFDIRQIYRDTRYWGFTRRHYRKQVKAILYPKVKP